MSLIRRSFEKPQGNKEIIVNFLPKKPKSWVWKCKRSAKDLFISSVTFRLKGIDPKKCWVKISPWAVDSGALETGIDLTPQPFLKATKKRRIHFYFEPGARKEVIAGGEGRSCGWLYLYPKNSRKGFFLGVIPGFQGVELIRFKKQNGDILIEMVEKTGGVKVETVKFKVFLGIGEYDKLTEAFSLKLASLSKIPLMKNTILGFSWPAFGKTVTQKIVEKEIQYLKGLAEGFVIDDGWEETYGDWQPNKRFPNISGLASKMRNKGIKPMLWIAPFLVSKKCFLVDRHPEWLVKDKSGRPVEGTVPLPLPYANRFFPVRESPWVLDISLEKVRKHLFAVFKRLVGLGFEGFKIDFLGAPSLAPLQNKSKTPVGFYRDFFHELRKRLPQITLVSGIGPFWQSIGLFEGTRFTSDSAHPGLKTVFPPFWASFLGKIPIVKAGASLYPFYSNLWEDQSLFNLLRNFFTLNPRCERETIINALKRHNQERYVFANSIEPDFKAPVLKNVFGLILDGVHLGVDPEIGIDRRLGRKVASRILEIKTRYGITNLFIGDSLARAGQKGRGRWKEFVKEFRSV